MEKKRVAILFFGLTRSLRDIYGNLKQALFNKLKKNNYDYDIFIHTYYLENPYINPWSGERITNYDNTSYKILNPKYYIIENQNNVEKNIGLQQYYSCLGDWKNGANTPEMCKYLIRNMVLALHSKKMVTTLFEKHKNDYDYAIITRPDQIFYSSLNTKIFATLNNKNIVIPYQHSWSGLNDRFCIATPDVAIKYGNALNNLKLYSQTKSIHSETYMKDYLESLGIEIIFSSIKTYLVRCKK